MVRPPSGSAGSFGGVRGGQVTSPGQLALAFMKAAVITAERERDNAIVGGSIFAKEGSL